MERNRDNGCQSRTKFSATKFQFCCAEEKLVPSKYAVYSMPWNQAGLLDGSVNHAADLGFSFVQISSLARKGNSTSI